MQAGTGALEGGCGGEGRGAADSKGNLGLHVGAFSLSFFSIVLKTSRIDSSSDFGPVLGPKLEAFSYFSLSQDGVLHRSASCIEFRSSLDPLEISKIELPHTRESNFEDFALLILSSFSRSIFDLKRL